MRRSCLWPMVRPGRGPRAGRGRQKNPGTRRGRGWTLLNKIRGKNRNSCLLSPVAHETGCGHTISLYSDKNAAWATLAHKSARVGERLRAILSKAKKCPRTSEGTGAGLHWLVKGVVPGGTFHLDLCCARSMWRGAARFSVGTLIPKAPRSGGRLLLAFIGSRRAGERSGSLGVGRVVTIAGP